MNTNTNTMAKTQKPVYGVGINDLAEPVKINGKALKFYGTWKEMLRRCYSKKYQTRYPTYRGCSVCSEWLSLSTFKIWFDANYRDGMSLDKDILIQGNKIYSPKACSFVPGYINNLLTNAGAIRGDYPLGVRAQKPNPHGQITTTYEARCHDGHGKRFTRTFKTVSEAAAWYSATKARIVKEQAIRAFEAGDITDDVYQALITREWGEN